MTPENFTYWLQGFFEISNLKSLDERQVQIIKDHLDLVFNKVTPNRNESISLKGFEGFDFDLMPKSCYDVDGYSNSVSPEENDLDRVTPKVYCSTSSVDLSFLTKKVC